MRGLAILLVVIASLLMVLFNRSAFYGDGGTSGFIKLDFGAIFYGAQWGGFWCAIAGLILFGVSAARSHAPVASMRNIPAGIGVGLCVYFLTFSMPEWSNFDRWKDGALGLRVYVTTKVAAYRERRSDAELKGAFTGKWISDSGASLAVDADKMVLHGVGGSTEFSAETCVEAPFARYSMADLTGVGYHFYRSGMLSSALFKELPDRRYPLMVYTCNGRDLALVRLDGRLFAVLYDGTSYIFKRQK